jgi:propionyl-CoA carboxylase alpha chain
MTMTPDHQRNPARITKLLVANRAEIASRVCRTARRMGIATAAICSEADADAGLPFVRDADEVVMLQGSAPADTYLSVPAVIGAAGRVGADALHPGYGFLSESPELARACAAASLTLVGPSAEAMEAMGSKVASKELMESAGVPVLPGRVVAPGRDVAEAAADIGYPLLVKAVFGGGGRGMRLVAGPDELRAAVESAQREAASAFGDGTVFLERYVERPRHVEVQIMGDTHGTIVSLLERECSIQRRHQKIIEEAPSPVVDPELRATLAGAAVQAAKAIDYVGAGTIEFVLAPDRSFFFLEVNTRLQVEHPVTEMVTGLDLVELQLRVARGEALADECVSAELQGHAIEARLYAEDPLRGFLPASGTLHQLQWPHEPQVRVDSGYETGSVVGTHYDAMLGKVIAWGPDRDSAITRLSRALGTTTVHGVTTNRDLLRAVLRHDEFRRGDFDTEFLGRHPPEALLEEPDMSVRSRLHAVAAALTACVARREQQSVQRAVTPGWRNVPWGWNSTTLRPVEEPEEETTVGYRFTRHGVEVEVDGVSLDLSVAKLDPEGVDLSLDGVQRRCRVQWVPAVPGTDGAGSGTPDGVSTAYVDSPLGSSVLNESPRLPTATSRQEAGSLVAPMPGQVIRVLVEPGAAVAAGQDLVVLEAMKMEHQVRAPHGGRVSEVRVRPGDQLEPGQVLVVVTEL